MLYIWDSFIEPIGIFIMSATLCVPIIFLFLRRNIQRDTSNDIFWYMISVIVGLLVAVLYMQYQKLYKVEIDSYETTSQLARNNHEITNSRITDGGILIVGETGEYGTLVNPFLMMYVPVQCRTKTGETPRFIVKVFNTQNGKKTPRDCHGAMCGSSGNSKNNEVMVIFDMEMGAYYNIQTNKYSNSTVIIENATIKLFHDTVTSLCQ